MKLYVLDIGSYNGRYTVCVVAESKEEAVELIKNDINRDSYRRVADDFQSAVWLGGAEDHTGIAPKPDEICETDLIEYEIGTVVEINNER